MREAVLMNKGTEVDSSPPYLKPKKVIKEEKENEKEEEEEK